MLCPFCQEVVDPKTAWKGSADRFYCSEFCADSEMIVPDSQATTDQATTDKALFDVQYLNRLERLVQLRRSASL